VLAAKVLGQGVLVLGQAVPVLVLVVLALVEVMVLAVIRNQNGAQPPSFGQSTQISSSNANRLGPSSTSTHCSQISQRMHCNKLHVSSLDQCRHLKGHHPSNSTRVYCHR